MKKIIIELPKRDPAKMVRAGVHPTKTILDKRTKYMKYRKRKHKKDIGTYE